MMEKLSLSQLVPLLFLQQFMEKLKCTVTVTEATDDDEDIDDDEDDEDDEDDYEDNDNDDDNIEDDSDVTE